MTEQIRLHPRKKEKKATHNFGRYEGVLGLVIPAFYNSLLPEEYFAELFDLSHTPIFQTTPFHEMIPSRSPHKFGPLSNIGGAPMKGPSSVHNETDDSYMMTLGPRNVVPDFISDVNQ